MYESGSDPDWLRDKALFEHEMSRPLTERGAFARLLNEARTEIGQSFEDDSFKSRAGRDLAESTPPEDARLLRPKDDHKHPLAGLTRIGIGSGFPAEGGTADASERAGAARH